MRSLRAFLMSGAVVAMGVGMSACESSSLSPQGSVSGDVRLVGQDGEFLATAEGVTVRAVDPEGVVFQDVTGPDGRFSISDLDPGSYDISFEKDGFGTLEAVDIFLGNIQADAVLPERSTIQILSAEASSRPCGQLFCVDIVARTRNPFPRDMDTQFFRAFLGLPGSLTEELWDETLVIQVPETDPGISQEGDVTIFNLRGIISAYLGALPPDGEVELLLHGATANFDLTFFDSSTQREIFPDLSPTSAETIFVRP